MLYMLILESSLFHHAFYREANHLVYGIRADGYGLLEASRYLFSTVISNINYSFFTWLDGFLCIGGNSTSAAGKCLMNDEWRCSCVGKGKRAMYHRLVPREAAKIMT